MTDATTPIGVAFELQRQSIKQSQQFVRTGFRIQEAVAESFLRSGVDAQRSLRRQHTELARRAVDAQLEAFESVLDLRREAEAAVPTTPQGSDVVAETTPESVRDGAEADEIPEDLAVDTTSAIEAATERVSDPETQRLLDLEGVGRTYVEGLDAAGVETLADLARAQANTVAEAAGISQVRATDWIQAAHPQT